MVKVKLKINHILWNKLIRELRLRGKGIRETGAVLLGKKNSNYVTEFICLDDLDPDCFSNSGIIFSVNGYLKLWKYCRHKNLVVKADIHTHPTRWVGMSTTDINNPFVSIKGHVALILPCFAMKKYINKCKVGMYEYKGNYNWKKLNIKQLKRTVI